MSRLSRPTSVGATSRLLAILATMALVATTSAAAATPDRGVPGGPPDRDVIRDSYIVVLESGDPGVVSGEHGRAHSASVTHVYRHALRGYAANMSERAAARIAADPRVAYVEADAVVTTAHHECGHNRPRPFDGPCGTGTVEGTVSDSESAGPLEGATVSVDDKTAWTNSDGNYSIGGVATGEQTVTATKDGFKSQSQTVTVQEDEPTTADFNLEPSDGDEPVEDEPAPDDYEIPTGVQRIFWEESSALDDAGGVNSVDVGVAVLDTGIAPHDDLTIAGGYNCTGGNARNYSDGNGHGTHVAGTIAANGSIVGVAPSAPLYAVKVLNNGGSGSWSTIICGIDWVTANAGTIEVANLSLGGSGTGEALKSNCNDYSSSLQTAICASVQAGVTYTASAGNSSADAKNFVPAAYPEVITVAAIADFDGLPGGDGSPTCRTDTDDTHANFSNYGTEKDVDQPGHVNITAPGVCITSTWTSNGYNTISGTSMSGPHVAGAAALWLHANQGGSPGEVRKALVDAANDGYDYTWGSDNDPVPSEVKPKLLDTSGF